MKNFTLLFLSVIFLFSCSKQNDCVSNNNAPQSTTTAPRPPSAPVNKVTITVNGQPLKITLLSYQRHRSGQGGSFSISASNAFQKITAVASPFSQYNPPWSMMYVMEVSYFTRVDSLGDWGLTLPRPIPRDDKIYFNSGDPLGDKTVIGNFAGTFIKERGTKEEQFIVVNGNFTLAF